MSKRQKTENDTATTTNEAQTTIVPVRFPARLLAMIDAEVARRKAKTPWQEAKVARSDVIREAVFKFLGGELPDTPGKTADSATLPKTTSAPKSTGKAPPIKPEGVCLYRDCTLSIAAGSKRYCSEDHQRRANWDRANAKKKAK